jgi:hypothetical protein
MVTPKIKKIQGGRDNIDGRIQEFLNTLDVRQIVKIDYIIDNNNWVICMILYIDFNDIRDIKIDTLIDGKIN